MKEFHEDPSVWEIRAAAYAARGDYKNAGKDQAHAIKEASSLGWNLTALQQRQELYAANRSWNGDLLDY